MAQHLIQRVRMGFYSGGVAAVACVGWTSAELVLFADGRQLLGGVTLPANGAATVPLSRRFDTIGVLGEKTGAVRPQPESRHQ